MQWQPKQIAMFTSVIRARRAENSLKRVWQNVPPEQEPVPDTIANLRAAAEAVAAVSACRFEVRQLYDTVRAVGNRVLVAPVMLAEEMAALCLMARDVCKKPVALLAPRHVLQAVEKCLLPTGMVAGMCEFGSKVALMTDPSDALKWKDVGLTGVILIAFEQPSGTAERVEGTRLVINFTCDRYACRGPALYSSPHFWAFTEHGMAHRGSRGVVESGLRELWTERGKTAWADACAEKTQARECVICMEPCRRQCVADCCTAAFCYSCIEPWVQEQMTCPSCRADADYTTMHRIEDDAIVID